MLLEKICAHFVHCSGMAAVYLQSPKEPWWAKDMHGCGIYKYIYIFGTLQQLNWQWKLSIFWKCKTPERVNFHQNGETSDRPKRGTWEAPRIKPYQEWPSEPVLLFFWHIMASHGTISVAFPSLKHFSNIHTHIVYIYNMCWVLKMGDPQHNGFQYQKNGWCGGSPILENLLTFHGGRV